MVSCQWTVAEWVEVEGQLIRLIELIGSKDKDEIAFFLFCLRGSAKVRGQYHFLVF
jgi:hypothetical protein